VKTDYLGITIPRLNRRSFFLTILVSMFVFLTAGLLFDGLLRGLLGIHTSNGEPSVLVIPFIVLWWVYAPFCALKRLHDTSTPGWWLILGLIPVVSIALFVRLFFSKGDAGANKYGKPEKRVYILGLGL